MTGPNAEKLKTCISAVLGVRPERITEDLSSDTVDTWDSLNQINLIAAIEQEFGIMLVADNLADYHSVAKLRTLLGQHGIEL